MSADKAYGRGQVLEIINTVITKMDESTHENREVYLHIAELAETIAKLKKEIADSRPDHVKNAHVPNAKEELDAIVEATAEATNSIMTTCEGMEKLATSLEADKASELSGLVTNIYEACTFQDITGQRIRKVFGVLLEIEGRVERIMQTLDSTVGPLKMKGEYEEVQTDINDEKTLLNGPQMADKAISQEEIDRLLAEFDN